MVARRGNDRVHAADVLRHRHLDYRCDGTHLRRVTRDGSSSALHWSPDGTQIYCFHNGGFCVVDATTGSETPAYGNDPRATRSPDGYHDAYTTTDGRNRFQIWMDDRPITKNRSLVVELSDPVWSPDSDWLAFSKSSESGQEEIDVVHRDGSALHRLTRSGSIGTNATPSWSPDGSLISFMRDAGKGVDEVFVVKPNGTGTRRLTSAGDILWAAWRPQRADPRAGRRGCPPTPRFVERGRTR